MPKLYVVEVELKMHREYTVEAETEEDAEDKAYLKFTKELDSVDPGIQCEAYEQA